MKYEFVAGDEKTTFCGVKLKRIRALGAIASLGVASGDLGGYIAYSRITRAQTKE